MSNIGPVASIKTKTQVIQNCWDYVLQNFHSFNTANKIKVALAIITKDMPTVLEGEVKTAETRIILITPQERVNADRASAVSI